MDGFILYRDLDEAQILVGNSRKLIPVSERPLVNEGLMKKLTGMIER